jgi:hypothetical protein
MISWRPSKTGCKWWEWKSNYLQLLNFVRHASRNFRKPYICQDELEERAKMAALDGNVTKQVELKKMRNAELTAAMFRRLKIIRGIANNKGFTSIKVLADWPDPMTPDVDLETLSDPKLCTSWKTANLPESIVTLTRACVQFLNYALRDGYAHPQWKAIMNIIIEKRTRQYQDIPAACHPPA